MNRLKPPFLLTGLTMLALLLGPTPARGADAQGAATKTSIPKIARLGKIQIGHSTQEDLAKHWGEGLTIIGGHPNSGRLWRVKGTTWMLHTDGFEYSKRGLVVDSLEIYEHPKELKAVPYARLPKIDFAWLGGITPGMSQEKVMQILQRQSFPFTLTPAGCEVSAKGFHALENHVRLKTWTTTLGFTNESLKRITLNASEGKP